MTKQKIRYSLKFFLSEIKSPWELAVFWSKNKELIDMEVEETTNPIMVLPGFLFNDLYTKPLRKLLGKKGLSCYGWEMGINKGFSWSKVDKLKTRVRELHQEHGEPVILIGWSLGGVYARELSRHAPEDVKFPITLASPFHIPSRTPINLIYRLIAGHKLQDLNFLMAQHRETEFPVPVFALNAKKDGIIPWPCCLAPGNRTVKSLVFEATHLGLPHNKKVAKKILENLC